MAVGARFIATFEANPRACAGTGSPPPVERPRSRAAPPSSRSSDAGATRAQRRALGLIVTTAADLEEQGAAIFGWGAAGALRGGRYAAGRGETIRLLRVRVVRGARVSGVLALGAGDRLEGTLRLAGPGVAQGRVRVRLAPSGHGRATGVLNERRVDLAFR